MNQEINSSSSPNNLEALVTDADQQLHQRKPPVQRRSFLPVFRWLFGAILTVLLVVLWGAFFRGVPQKVIDQDLIELLQLARQKIEAEKEKLDQLPGTLPTIALSHLVRYTPDRINGSYLLRAQNGKTVFEWSSDAPETFTKVNTP